MLATTRAIFREYQISGLTSLAFHAPMLLEAARIKHPFWDWELALLAKAASENEGRLQVEYF